MDNYRTSVHIKKEYKKKRFILRAKLFCLSFFGTIWQDPRRKIQRHARNESKIRDGRNVCYRKLAAR